MTKVYLGSPVSEAKAKLCEDMPVLLSFPDVRTRPTLITDYVPTFSNVLIDSGAYSELAQGIKVDLEEYKDFSARLLPISDAVAGLDDISGDWHRSMANYEAIPWSFPTIHEADPIDIIDDLIEMARERNGWLGIGLTPPRTGKEHIVRNICDRIPEDIHVHGFALRGYTHIPKMDSVDSTNWFRDAWKVKNLFPFLTNLECLEIVVKRYKREPIRMAMAENRQGDLFLDDNEWLA